VQNKATLGAQAYVAYSAMLRANTSLLLKPPPFETAGADEMLRESRNQLTIEQRLNSVVSGRLLASSKTTGEMWVAVLRKSNSYNVDDSPDLYSLL
jgi:hypothetical protein